MNHSCVVITDFLIIVVSVVSTLETGDETTSDDTSQGDTLLSVGLSGVERLDSGSSRLVLF